MSGSVLRLSASEGAARKAGLSLASISGERLATALYALQPAEGKCIDLLSGSDHLTVAERRWVEEHRATNTQLGCFPVGGNFISLQTDMARAQRPVGKPPE